MAEKKRLAMLCSGGGTTACQIIRAVHNGGLTGIDPCLVVVSKEGAGAITAVRREGILPERVVVIARRRYANAEEFGEKIIEMCHRSGVNLIGQYGWLPTTPANVIKAFLGMMINQHPGPLDPGRPDFGGKGMYGRRVHCARLLFVRWTGRNFFTEVTAQRVAEKVDQGTLLGQRTVEIRENDTVDTLQQRALLEEYKLHIKVLQQFSSGGVREITRGIPLVSENEVPILEKAKQAAILLYPNG